MAVPCILLISISFFLPKLSQSSLNEGNFFLYEIKDAGYYAKLNEHEIEFTDYRLGSQTGPIGLIVNATVEDIETTGNTFFRFWINNRSSIAYFTAEWFDLSAILTSYRILYYVYEMVENFNEISIAELVLYQIRPFIHPDYNDYLQMPEKLGSEICSFFSVWLYRYPDIICTYDYSENDNILCFESWIGGKINNQFGKILTNVIDYPSDISFGNQFQFAVNKETGIVQGFGQRGWVEGTIDDQIVKVSMKIEYELKNYSLAKYKFGEFKDFTKNSSIAVILIPSICIPLLVISSILIISKIKKSYRKNN